ncbi:MAG TPA: TolC family protein, partial [Polyangiaceae bacterium]
DAGIRYADRRSRDALATIADLTVGQLSRTVDAEVGSAVVALEASQAALAASEQAMNAARQSADETAILYRQGLAKAIELVDANNQRFLAEVNYSTAEYSTALAYLGLRQALGLDPLGTELQ